MNLYGTKNKPQINADERRFNGLDSRLPVVVWGQKTGTELAKGCGQIATPLEIETSGSFKTTEISEYTENHYPSMISMPSVVDYPYSNQKKTQER